MQLPLVTVNSISAVARLLSPGDTFGVSIHGAYSICRLISASRSSILIVPRHRLFDAVSKQVLDGHSSGTSYVSCLPFHFVPTSSLVQISVLPSMMHKTFSSATE